jgi:hypothetical protein
VLPRDHHIGSSGIISTCRAVMRELALGPVMISRR